MENNSIHIVFKYHFDEDGFSMYEKTHNLKGEITIDKNGAILKWILEEVRTGVAANLEPYKMKQDKD